MQRFQNKKVMITGAASGIGRATALRIAQEGGHLALLDMNVDRLKTLSEELKAKGTEVVYAQCDVTNFDETGKVINQLANELGGIQALSHNAGILRAYLTHEMTSSQWMETINVNLNGTFNVNRHALPHLLKNERSYLVNNSSNAVNQSPFWLSAYVASKGGVMAFTRALAMEYTIEGLRANSILPGLIQTELLSGFKVPEGANPNLTRLLPPSGAIKFVSPDYVASVIALLMSEEGSHINGTEITIDGGRLL